MSPSSTSTLASAARRAILRALALACCVCVAPSANPTTAEATRTLEDLYGPTGNRFQAAVTFNLLGPTPTVIPSGSFGMAIDDMFVTWKEVSLGPDQTDCALGQCAALELPTGTLYANLASLPISLVDGTPYGSACVGGTNDGRSCQPAHGHDDCTGGGSCQPALNDCDLDGFFDGLEDDEDCDDDGVADVVVRVSSDADTGEIVVLNRDSLASTEYRGVVTVSALNDAEGVVFVAQPGSDLPVVTVTYLDHEDGTGRICQNDVVVENRGVVQAATMVFMRSCDVQVVGTRQTDNGDGDAFADSAETIVLQLELRSFCFEHPFFGPAVELTNCVARLWSDSPEVACIRNPAVFVGDLPPVSLPCLPSTGCIDPPLIVTPPFSITLDGVLADRDAQGLGAEDPFVATFRASIACDQIDGVETPQTFELPLDVDIDTAGQQATAWTEDFENGGQFPTTFENLDLDAGIPGNSNAEGLINGDGFRCQYSDPDWVNGNAYNVSGAGITDCFPGTSLAQAAQVFWKIDGTSQVPDSIDPRSFEGDHALYYGVFDEAAPNGYTTPLATIDAAATVDIHNLGPAEPELRFWHMVSLMDGRYLDTPPFTRSADRGVVQIRTFDTDDQPTSPWTTLVPTQNRYDSQAFDGFFNCLYDPTDDGNTEDDFFDPTDPGRETGPSSTCFPGFQYSCVGSTIGAFDPSDICRGQTPPQPDEAPVQGDGTWVETVVDLDAFRGKRAKFRFLTTSIKVGIDDETWHDVYGGIPEGDDGWWIDNVTLTERLDQPAEMRNDRYDLGSCTATCSGGANDGLPCLEQDDCPGGSCPVASRTTCIAQCLSARDGGGQPVSCTDDTACELAMPGDVCLNPCQVGTCDTANPPACSSCSVVTPRVTVTTDDGASTVNPASVTTAAPGRVVSFDAANLANPTFADACNDGPIQFRFCEDGDPDGAGPAPPSSTCGDPEDRILRAFTEIPTLSRAPQRPLRVVVEARCATEPDCVGAVAIEVGVACPGGIDALGLQHVIATDKATLAWPGDPLDVAVWQSADYALSSALDGYTAAGPFTYVDATTSIPIAGDPAPGFVRAWLVTVEDGVAGSLNTSPGEYFCNSRTWRSGGTAEVDEATPGRDTTLGDPSL